MSALNFNACFSQTAVLGRLLKLGREPGAIQAGLTRPDFQSAEKPTLLYPALPVLCV